MKITFIKSATKTGSFIGDSYKMEYLVNLRNGEIAKFQYQDFSSKIYWGDREITIEPNLKHLTIIDYDIKEDGALIGKIKKSSWTHINTTIEISNSEIFKFNKITTGLFNNLFSSSNNSFQILNSKESIKYNFHKGEYFKNHWNGNRYKKIKGEIELQENNLLVALTGLLLIELMLMEE